MNIFENFTSVLNRIEDEYDLVDSETYIDNIDNQIIILIVG